MLVWKKAYRVWMEFCPYIRRELLSKEDFVKWAKSLRLITAAGEENDFCTFLILLEECEIINPLGFAQSNRGRIYQTDHLEENPTSEKSIPYYHPLQFFEVINWFRHNSLTRRPYHLNETFRDYFSLRKIDQKISKKEFELRNHEKREFSGRRELISITKGFIDNLTKERDEHPLKDHDFLKGKELLKYLKIGWTRNILSEERLILWIKIESLLLQDDAHIYAKHSSQMRLNVDWIDYFGSNNKIEQEINRYREWRKKIKEERASYLGESEKTVIKGFQRDLGKIITNNTNWSLFKNDF